MKLLSSPLLLLQQGWLSASLSLPLLSLSGSMSDD